MERWNLEIHFRLGKYRAGGTIGSGTFYGKIRECPGSVIPGLIT